MGGPEIVDSRASEYRCPPANAGGRGEEDEDKFADLSARYLNAWADVARIGSKKKSQQSSIPDNIKPDPSDFETKVDLLENEAPSDNETKRINRSQIKNRRRPIQTSRLFRS